MKSTTVFSSAVLLAACCAAGVTQAAAITQLSGPGDFVAGTIIVEDFESGTAGSPPADTAQFTFEATAEVASASTWTSNVTSSGTRGLRELIANEPMVILFTTPVLEVGATFGNDDFNLSFDAMLEVYDAANNSLGSVQVAANSNDYADQFIGLRSDVPISSAAFTYERPAAEQLSVFIDDLRVGLVPEPSAAALACIAAAGLCFPARRRAG